MYMLALSVLSSCTHDHLGTEKDIGKASLYYISTVQDRPSCENSVKQYATSTLSTSAELLT